MARIALWAASAILAFALLQIAAEWYLVRFGAPGLDLDRSRWLASAAYWVRHGPMLLLLLLLGYKWLTGILLLLTAAAILHGGRSRSLAVASAMGCVVLILVQPWVAEAARSVRNHQLPHLAERLMPLVNAIESHSRERGAAPPSLAALVPVYLTSVEGYGVRGCRKLEYEPPTVNGVLWQVWMECPNGLLTLDRFSYQPGNPSGERRLHGWRYQWD